MAVHDIGGKEREQLRKQKGQRASWLGLLANVFLAAGKILAGSLSGSVSIVADGVNNLTDTATSLISLVSFAISAKPADEEHPFGHARAEYIASMAVSFLIMLLSFELIKTSIGRIITPEQVQMTTLSAVILVVSIVLKGFMFIRYRRLSKKLDSTMMRAAAADSISDVAATGAVLAAAIIAHFTGLALDGWMGLLVALFIGWAGIGIFRETTDQLLGHAQQDKLVQEMTAFIKKYDGVLGIHDLIVHTYGPRHVFASVHVEVDHNADVMQSHRMIDEMERDIALAMGISLVVHMDPIVVDDPRIAKVHEVVVAALKKMDGRLDMHDIRLMPEGERVNVLFDVVVPPRLGIPDAQLRQSLEQTVRQMNKSYVPMITLDRAYIQAVD